MLPSSLLAPRRKVLASLMAATAAALAFAGPASQANADVCAPSAYQPLLAGGGYAYAHAYIPCSGTWDISLRNNAGSVLGHAGGSAAGEYYVGQIRCAGAIVHTFVWVNVGGVVKSDTSTTIQC
jgi:hypothetical protein